MKKSNADRTFVTLSESVDYTNYAQKTETIEKGRRFKVSNDRRSTRYLDNDGNLVLEHWFCMGCALVVPNSKLVNVKPENIWR
jgi:hypothetical protein